MSKIKVKGYDMNDPYGGGIGGDVNFSLVSSPKDGRKQIMGFMGCKAYIHDAAQSHVLGTRDYGSHYDKNRNPLMDMNKLRLLVGTNPKTGILKEYKKKLFAAKRMLNLFEEAAGWKPSKITSINHSAIDEGVWLITGPKQWMRSPQMLSMVTLIIRAAVRNGPVDPKNEEEATELLKRWATNSKRNYSERCYLATCWDKLFLIAKNYKSLFDGLTIEQRYNSGKIGSHSNGIVNWCSGKAGLDELNKRIKDLCKKHGVEIRKGYY